MQNDSEGGVDFFVKAYPPQLQKHSWECANSTSPMLLGEHDFAKVWELGCGEFYCDSQYQWVRGEGCRLQYFFFGRLMLPHVYGFSSLHIKDEHCD